MIVKQSSPIPLFSRRFLSRQIFSVSEGRGAAIAYGLLSFGVGALFASTHALFGAYPFAVGYLAAASRRYPFALAGALVGALTLGPRGYVYAFGYLFLSALRLFFSYPRGEGRIFPPSPAYFEEEAPLRVATACVVGSFFAVYQMTAGGLSTASFLFSLTMIAVTTLSAYAYLPIFLCGRTPCEIFLAEGKEKGEGGNVALDLCLSAFLFTVTLALRPFSLLGVSFSPFFAVALALFLPARWGTLRGTAVATLAALGTLAPAYLPSYALLAAAVGLLYTVGPFYGLAAGLALSLGAAYLVVGGRMIIDFLPEVVVSASLSFPLYRRLPALGAARGERETHDPDTGEENSRAPALQRMEMLSSAYRSLSQVFSLLAEGAARPSEGEYREACLSAFAQHCDGCERRAVCWEAGERRAHRAAECLSEQYAAGTMPAEIFLPESLLDGCPSLPKIRRSVSESCATLEESKRRGERNSLFAENYRMTAEMLSDAASREASEEKQDRNLARAARVIFSELGIPVREVRVFGERRRTLYAFGVERESAEGAKELHTRLCNLCDCRFGPPVFFVRGGRATMRLESRPRFAVSCHGARAAQAREVSGDAFSTFHGDGAYFYALLADGMGSGREAAITSGICGAFLQKTLAAGASKGVALRALNTVLSERGCECSSTIDLLELDLLFGRASFVKSGAAASYVRRGESLFRIRSATVPIGILDTPDAERVRFDVQAGDVIVMLSDGISQAPEDSLWLVELLSGDWEGDLDLMAEKILECARTHAERGDDMTVELLHVQEAS